MKEWHSMTASVIEAELNSSLKEGISVSEARKRLEKEKRECKTRSSLFVKGKKSPVKNFFSFFLSPFVLLLLAISFSSFIFGRYVLGACVFLTALLSCCTIGVSSVISQKRIEQMNDFSSPMVKAIRSGKKIYTDGRNAVVGDLVTFSRGDLIVADVRLIDSNGLVVKELYNTKDGVRNRTVTKDHCAEYDPNTIIAPNAANMLYAGSVVIEGEATGLVVATANNTYLSRYLTDGAIDLAESEGCEIKSFYRYFRMAYVAAVALLAILSLISLITLREYPFVANFLLFISAFSAVSVEMVGIIHKQIFSRRVSSIFRADRANNDVSASIRGTNTLETLSKVTHVVLLGNTAFSSGTAYVDEIYSAGERFKKLSSSELLGGRILGCINAYIRAQRDSGHEDELSKDGISDQLLSFLRDCEFDFSAAMLTTASLYYIEDKPGETGHACVETNKGQYRVTVTMDKDILSHCSCVRTQNGNGREMYRFFADSIDEFISDKQGVSKCVFVVTEYDGEAVLEAILSLSQQNSNEIAASLSNLGKMNVRTIVMSLEEKSIASFSGDLSEIVFKGKVAYASDFKRQKKAISDNIGEYCAFFGFSADEYAELLREMRKRGSCVAAYGVEDNYYDVMAEADIAISCDLINYSSDEYKVSVYEKMLPEGRESSLRCSQRTRLLSKMIVKRTHKQGGGLSSVVNSLSSAREAELTISLSVVFIALILCLTLPLVIMSAVTGIALVNPANITILTFYSMLAAAFVFPHCDVAQNKDIARNSKGSSCIFEALKNSLPKFISRSSASVAFCALIGVLEIFKVFGDNSEYSFAAHIGAFSVILIDLSMYLKANFIRITFKAKLIMAALLSSALVGSAAVFAITVFERGSFSGVGDFEFLLAPVFVLVYLISNFISQMIEKKRREGI